MNYEGNFGYYDLDADPDEPAFFAFVKSQSKPTNCLRCREPVRLQAGRDNCARCCEAMERATVGWFDFAKKTYKEIAVDEQCEVLSAIGDVALGDDGKASLHVHVVLGLSDGSTRCRRLLRGTVHPTLEVVLTETPAKLRRRKRADLRIALIDADPRRFLEQ